MIKKKWGGDDFVPVVDALWVINCYVPYLKKVLAPFGDLDIHDLRDRPDDWIIYGRNDTILTVGDFRRAAAFSEQEERNE